MNFIIFSLNIYILKNTSLTRYNSNTRYISWLVLPICDQLIGLVGRVFANGLGDRDSIPGRVIPKTSKMVLNTSLLNTQYYKVRIEGKVEQSRKRSSALHYTSV